MIKHSLSIYKIYLFEESCHIKFKHWLSLERMDIIFTWHGADIFGDKTTINFQYIYHIAFWRLENSTTLLAPNK